MINQKQQLKGLKLYRIEQQRIFYCLAATKKEATKIVYEEIQYSFSPELYLKKPQLVTHLTSKQLEEDGWRLESLPYGEDTNYCLKDCIKYYNIEWNTKIK